MCGLAGIIGFNTDKELNSFKLGCERFLRQRGPDALNHWSSNDGRINLAHAHLAIVDRSGLGGQPMVSEELSLTIMLVGEIYNYRELKSHFKDYPYQGDSDTEVLFPLYYREGIKGLRRLKGMFTIVIVDTKKKECLLIRDAIGKKPFYVSQSRGKTFFGSSVLPLLAGGAEQKDTTDEIKKSYMENGFIPYQASANAAFKTLLPGTYWRLDWNGHLKETGRITPNVTEVFENESLFEAQKRFNLLFEKAVYRRLENNPTPTVLLSGGLDSTAIAFALKKVRPRLFTIRSGLPLMNDEFYARYAAYRLGLPVEVLSIPWLNKPASVFSCLEKQDEPLGIFSFVPLSQMMQKVHENARVVLTGDGGDEVLLGYGQTDNWLGGDPHGEDRPWDIGPPPPQWMSAWGRRAVGADLAGHGFVKVDRTSAENAVESRAPFLDWDLVTYLRSLPAGYLLAGGKSKSLVHSYLAEFPSWFLNRPKIGFKIHLRWMLAASNFSGMRDLVSNETVARFSKYLPQSLDKPAVQWRTRDIFNAFPLAWRLLAWSQYEKRLREVRFLCG